MHRIRNICERALAFCAGLMMALVFGVIFANSVRRYTTGRSWEWGEELPVYLAIYGVMFGMGLAYLQDRHIRFTLLTDLLPTHAARWLRIAMDAAACATGVALAWSGVVFASRRPHIEASGLIGAARDLAAATGMEAAVWLGRLGTWQASIAIGGAILALVAAIRLAARLGER